MELSSALRTIGNPIEEYGSKLELREPRKISVLLVENFRFSLQVGWAFLTDDNANHLEGLAFPPNDHHQAGKRRITITTFPWISSPSSRST